MIHGDSADLLEVTTPVLSNESLSGDAIDLHSAASINVVGIDKLQVEPSRLIYEIDVTPRYNLSLNKQPFPSTFKMMFLNCFSTCSTFKIMSGDNYLARRLSSTICDETNYYIFCCEL